MSPAAYEVVVLAGGDSRRFGSDKLALLLDRVLAGLPADAPVVCVGPARPTPSRVDVAWVREEPAGSGPLAGVGAAVRARAGDDRPAVVLLAGGDMPAVGAAVAALVETLAAAGADIDAVLLSDPGGRPQLLASAWRRDALVTVLDAVGEPAGVPLQRLLDHARVALLPDRWDAAHDVDTPEDLKPTGG